MKTEKIITELLEQMTLDEKIGMVHGNGLFQNKGVERLGNTFYEVFRWTYGCSE